MPLPSRRSVSHAVLTFPALAPKHRGEISEAAFRAKETCLAFKIVCPRRNSKRYDVRNGADPHPNCPSHAFVLVDTFV